MEALYFVTGLIVGYYIATLPPKEPPKLIFEVKP